MPPYRCRHTDAVRIFFTIIKGAPPARQCRASGPDARRETRSHRAGMRDGNGHHHQDHGGKRWASWPTPGAAAMSRSFGRKPYGRAAAARSAGPHPAGRRYPPSRCADGRACKGRAWPVLCAGHPLAAQDHSQGRSLRSRLRWRYAPPLSVIFHGKTSAPIGRTGQS
jgi:hypothetical protein